MGVASPAHGIVAVTDAAHHSGFRNRAGILVFAGCFRVDVGADDQSLPVGRPGKLRDTTRRVSQKPGLSPAGFHPPDLPLARIIWPKKSQCPAVWRKLRHRVLIPLGKFAAVPAGQIQHHDPRPALHPVPLFYPRLGIGQAASIRRQSRISHTPQLVNNVR